MAVAWPSVKARLVELLPTLTPAAAMVFDGPVPTGEQPASYWTVGWQPSTDDEDAGSFEQTTGKDGFSAAETGTVLLELAVVDGADMPSSFTLFDALADYVQATPTLGILVTGTTSGLSAAVVPEQNRAGAVHRLLVTFTYSTDVV